MVKKLKDDNSMAKRRGIIIQMTGMSGAGKTTLAAEVKKSLEAEGYKVAVLDGDVYRQTLCSDLGFSKEDRLENIKRLGRFAYAMAPDFDLVVLAAINPYEEARQALKEAYNAKLLFVDCALEELVQRDTKGLYRRALLDLQDPDYIPAFTGISDPFERPVNADLVVDTEHQTIRECVDAVVEYLKNDLAKSDEDKTFQDFLTKLKEQAFLFGDKKDNSRDYVYKARLFRGLFELNNQELFQFIFGECRDSLHFEDWLKNRIGEAAFGEAKQSFLAIDTRDVRISEAYTYQILTADQLDFWKDEGFLVVPQVVDAADCDRVRMVICGQLGVNLKDRNTWCPSVANWQGILLFSAKSEAEEAIRHHPTIRAVFEDLYRQKDIFSMRSPLGYMPPLSTGYSFKGSPLHWDIDMEIGPRYHIQGMVYLHDVDEEGGAFSLIPKMHDEFQSLIEEHKGMHEAAEVLRTQNRGVKIAGKKGDLILWVETMPHAATPNESDIPRFVQYITYEQFRLT
ncbi:adenylyl-sulfate kinase [Sphingobacterium sp. xlx-130]|uniref:adenylyl-sulfate kinase n=1 Tax=Sphingobacterium sp. xlx-130 TaxID=2654323 RepID=UPI0021CF0D11|nr:adenylyl-sulfate kinase [Sphingobacterium sp. xlx-130]